MQSVHNVNACMLKASYAVAQELYHTDFSTTG